MLSSGRSGGREHVLFYPHLSAREASVLYGQHSDDPEEAMSRFHDRIIGLPQGSRYRYPAFQFPRDKDKQKFVQDANLALDAQHDPWGVASWWLTPNAELDGNASPAELLDQDDYTDISNAVAAASKQVNHPLPGAPAKPGTTS
jgi:hypothetical protein